MWTWVQLSLTTRSVRVMKYAVPMMGWGGALCVLSHLFHKLEVTVTISQRRKRGLRGAKRLASHAALDGETRKKYRSGRCPSQVVMQCQELSHDVRQSVEAAGKPGAMCLGTQS